MMGNNMASQDQAHGNEVGSIGQGFACPLDTNRFIDVYHVAAVVVLCPFDLIGNSNTTYRYKRERTIFPSGLSLVTVLRKLEKPRWLPMI